MKIFKKEESVFSEKHNRAYRLYSDIFEINIKRVIKRTIINTISRDRLNSIKRLSNVLI